MKTMTTAELERAVHTGLKELRMPAIRGCFREKADLARRESLSFERFLLELVQQEQQARTAFTAGSDNRACPWRRPWTRSTADDCPCGSTTT